MSKILHLAVNCRLSPYFRIVDSHTFFGLLCRICLLCENNCLPVPLLHQLSLTSPLIWTGPTSDRPSLLLRGAARLRFDTISGTCQTSQVRLQSRCALATLSDPGGTCKISLYRFCITACCVIYRIGFRFSQLTGLYHFTLSHCGSRAPLTTLKSDLAASIPSLGTDCLLGFIGYGLSPYCIVNAFWRTYGSVRLLTCRLLPSAPLRA